MSTKIFNGYILPKEFKTLDQAITWSRKLQTKFEATCAPRLAEVIAKDAAGMIDQVIAHNVIKLGAFGIKSPQFLKRCSYSKNNPVAMAFDNARENLKESVYHCLRDDFTLSLSLLRSRKRTLCLIFGGSSFVERWFEKTSGVEPFPYWDNEDEPEGMTRAQWKERGKIWEEALPENATPAQAGLAITSKEASYFLWGVKEKIPAVPNRLSRARQVAKNVVSHLECLKYPQEELFHRCYTICEAVRSQKKRQENFASLILPHIPELRSWKEMEKYAVETYDLESKKP